MGDQKTEEEQTKEASCIHLLDNCFKAIEDIHNYFGYEEGWEVIPLNDSRDYYWSLHVDESGSGEVHFSDSTFDFNDDPEYWDEILMFSHDVTILYPSSLEKAIYRTQDFTMIAVDTQTHGNKFLRIFDNKKEIKSEL